MKSLIGIGAFLFTLILSMGAVSSCGGGGDTATNPDIAAKATVSGTVLDSNGNPIVAALVTITSTPLTTDTDPDGYFSAEVEAGDHTITVSVGSYIVGQYDFTVGDESFVDLGDLEPNNPYYPGGATWYKNIDGDLHSDGISAQSEIPLDGYDLAANLTGTTGDCNDDDGSIYPGAVEICNDIDDDCDGVVDNGNPGGGLSCDTGVPDVCTAGTTLCEDGSIVCDQDVLAVAELCDGLDNDCDGVVDENLTTTFYFDGDRDGYGSALNSMDACSVPDGYVSDNSDCDDSNFLINPDSTWYRDADGDGYTDFSTSEPQCIRPDNYLLEDELASLSEDCDDNDPGINPGATDIPDDGIDQDCSGSDDSLYAVAIPAGCFSMGDVSGGGKSDELPVHNVCITGFYMDVHEVTNAEYKQCVDAGYCAPPSQNDSETRTTYYGDTTYDNFPVIYVDWWKAEDYCTWQGKRLPTEAEWEYAARGGLTGKRFPWGDTINGTDANYNNSGDIWDNDTSPVKSYSPNGHGLYDMAGNVQEWINDWYSATYYSESPVYDPQGPATGLDSVLRGGAWDDPPENIRSAVRHPDWRGVTYWNVGFRCAED